MQLIVTTPEKWDIITRKSGDRTYTQVRRAAQSGTAQHSIAEHSAAQHAAAPSSTLMGGSLHGWCGC